MSSVESSFLSGLFDDLEKDRLVLPTLPEVALKVRDTLEDENSSMMDVAHVITNDAALSARLIQISNSPLLRASRLIETVEAAVTRMGSNMVRNLVTSIAMEQMFQATTDATDTRLRAVWENSTQIAAIASALSIPQANLQADQALLAGLVHDIGILPILSRAEDYPDLLDNEKALDHIITHAHVKIGEAILRTWNFSAELVNVAAEHENLSRCHEGPPDYVDLVIVANMQDAYGTDRPYAQVDWASIPAFEKLGMETDISAVDMDEVNSKIEMVKTALSG
ncbi:HD-GYP domain (HD superfamily hydrolase) [hydrothermal vent metagenome]|uniref:HD-GYP domain (HD superfamily hydrolase) n=1 Tax=hydrothermal vent metagenome TaxID=652676 RepID=A0A3B1BEA3_9ZZZZ